MKTPILLEKLPADRDPQVVYLNGLATGSRRTMRAALENIAQVFGVRADQLAWSHLRHAHIRAIRAALARTYAPSTANRHLTALRGVLKEAWRLGHLSADDYMKLNDIKAIKGKRQPRGRYLTQDEFARMLHTCAPRRAIDIRDLAVLLVLYACGLRREELVKLHIRDFNAGALRVFGKGNAERVVPVNSGVLLALQRWLEVYPTHDKDVALFVPINKHGKFADRPLTTQAVYNMVVSRALKAGIEKLSPHDFRRTLVSNLFDAGVDVATIADIVGHVSIEMTRKYDRRSERVRRDAVEKLTLPNLPE